MPKGYKGAYETSGGLPREVSSIKVGMKHMHQPEMGPRPSRIKKIQPDKKVGAGKRGKEY